MYSNCAKLNCALLHVHQWLFAFIVSTHVHVGTRFVYFGTCPWCSHSPLLSLSLSLSLPIFLSLSISLSPSLPPPPPSSPDGYLYDKEAILECLLHQKRESECRKKRHSFHVDCVKQQQVPILMACHWPRWCATKWRHSNQLGKCTSTCTCTCMYIVYRCVCMCKKFQYCENSIGTQ